MAETFDLVVIGAGPGGYVCAIKAAQLGLRTAIVEKRADKNGPLLGGTCLNIGCIPSKALLHASEMFHEAGHSLEKLGVKTGKPKLDLKKMMGHKDGVVKANVDGVAYLMKKNRISVFSGTGSIPEAGKVTVAAQKGEAQTLETKNIVIATGSDVAGIPGVEFAFDEKKIVSSTGALELGSLPKHLIVVGGGVIGLEMGSVWMRLGAKVTVIEYLDSVLGAMDGEISDQFQRILEKQGMVFELSARVTSIKKNAKGVEIGFEPAGDDKKANTQKITGDAVLVATGRRPFIEGLGLEALGVKTERGMILTDKNYQTNIAGIYAIGDVIAGPMLAHKAEDEGVAVAEMLAGQHPHVNYNVIPGVVYTSPEVASVGKTEEELKAAKIDYVVGKFPFMANGRARAMNQTEGFVKFLADKKTDRVLGVHIIGFGAGEMIHEAAVLMEFGGSSEDLGRICHAHPSLSEAVREAALSTFAKPLHM